MVLSVCLREERDMKAHPKPSLLGNPFSNPSQLERRGDVQGKLAVQAGGAGSGV